MHCKLHICRRDLELHRLVVCDAFFCYRTCFVAERQQLMLEVLNVKFPA